MITQFPRLGVANSAGHSMMQWDLPAAWGQGGVAPVTWNMVRRSAALHLLLSTLPAADGTISQDERQAILACYAGILTGGLPAGPRRSMNMMLLLNTLPPGDGTIDQADRQNTAWNYGGILAGAAAVIQGFIPEDQFDESVL